MHPSSTQALQPVMDVLGIPEEKMVRCLLASMPPGCLIPVHHDTGHWVQHTHRVHVAIITDVDEVRKKTIAIMFFPSSCEKLFQNVAATEGRKRRLTECSCFDGSLLLLEDMLLWEEKGKTVSMFPYTQRRV